MRLASHVGGVQLGKLSEEAVAKDATALGAMLNAQVAKGLRQLEELLGERYTVQTLSWVPISTGFDSVFLLLTIVGQAEL